MIDIIEIGTAKAQKGERAYGEVIVSRRVDGTPISIPVILVRGTKPGPTLCINGCIHGDEFSGMEAINRLANELNPVEMSGTLVAVPVVNQPALEEAKRVNHYDHANLNRIFPGSADGTLTQKIAHTFLNEIVLKCNAMVDLHGGGGNALITKVVVAQGGYEELVWDLALATGFDLLWLGGSWGGTGRISALQAGIPAITVESGGGMVCTEADVAVHYNASKSVMRHFGMIEGEADYPKKYRVVKGTQSYAPTGGFFHPIVTPGMNVQAGDILATISDMYGRTIEELRSPIDCVLVDLMQMAIVSPGDSLYILGEVVDTRERK